jgi:intracellular septation protein
MQLLFEFFPLIAFFLAFLLFDLFVATAVLMVALALQIAYQWFRHRKVNKMLLISGIIAAVLGTITLVKRDLSFIQWKLTVVNWLFAVACLGSQFFFGSKTLPERVMGHAIELEQAVWRQLNMMWVANFAVIGALNLYIMYNFSDQVWGYFKSVGMIGLSLLTLAGQAIWISSRMTDRSADSGGGS